MPNEPDMDSTADLYSQATRDDWKSVDAPATDAASAAPAPTPGQGTEPLSKAETIRLMNVARSILVNENGSVG
ncbi:hypothetical protein LDO31_08600 [Luteimonas sp. XNQY3]|nr:hypothetical protein [Luteimonas sp. XNQY3]MCD9006293.1 hypothetical protein [Luteimonas sp. XNQY3]